MEQGRPEFCLSCGAPLNVPDMKGLAEQYCVHCTDDDGNVKSRDEIKEGIAMWIARWQGVDHETAERRAEHYMQAMPAWAEEE